MMDQSPLTCDLVDQRELDQRYVARQLSDAEAAAFELHFFGCDRCWNLVKGGAGVRAAVAPSAAAPGRAPSRAWWKPLALAAGLGLIAFGASRLIGPGTWADPDAIRGAEDSISVVTQLGSGQWRAAWPAVPGAASYRVRVFSEAGSLLLTRDLADTAVNFPADSLATLGQGGALYLELQGFDALRRLVARSPLIPLRSPGAPR